MNPTVEKRKVWKRKRNMSHARNPHAGASAQSQSTGRLFKQGRWNGRLRTHLPLFKSARLRWLVFLSGLFLLHCILDDRHAGTSTTTGNTITGVALLAD